MQEQLTHIQNVILALGVLFVAYLLTIPLRRRYGTCDSVEAARRSGRQFLGEGHVAALGQAHPRQGAHGLAGHGGHVDAPVARLPRRPDLG